MTYWVLIFWLSTEPAPHVIPVLFTTKSECTSVGKELNGITAGTVKISRNYNCSPAIVEHSVK